MLWLYSMTTRRDPTGHVWANPSASRCPSSTIATLDGAYARRRARQGTIEPGKLADLVVLKEDPFTVAAEHWQGIKVERTMLGGGGYMSLSGSVRGRDFFGSMSRTACSVASFRSLLNPWRYNIQGLSARPEQSRFLCTMKRKVA